MNFRGHFAGGIAAGTVAASLAAVSGALEIGGLDIPPGEAGAIPAGLAHVGGVFTTAWFMALFPDLDTASVPQRWFLRGMFALLVAVLAWGRMDLFAVLAFATLLPLIHRHRGWTHWKAAPWAVALFLAAAYEYLRAEASWFSGFSWENVGDFLLAYWQYVAACVIGHYTHLLLDSRRVRWLPFIRNPDGHH